MTQLTRHRLPRARRRRRRAAGLCACCVELQRQLQPCRIRRHLLRRRRNTARAERVQRMPQAQPVPSRWTQKLGMHCAAPSTKGRRRATSTMSMRSAPLSVRFFCCDMLRRVLAYERAVRNWRLCCGAAGHASSVARRRGGEGAVPVDRAYCRNRGASAGAMQIQVADVVCRPRLLCRRRSRLRLRCGLVLRALRQKRT